MQGRGSTFKGLTVILLALGLLALGAPGATAIDPYKPRPDTCLIDDGNECVVLVCESQGDLIYPLSCCPEGYYSMHVLGRPGGGSNIIATYLCVREP